MFDDHVFVIWKARAFRREILFVHAGHGYPGASQLKINKT